METTKEELTRVQRVSDGKYNLIDANGKLLLDEWYEWVDYFHDGFAVVQRAYEKYNYIDKNGKILLDEWYNWVDDFRDGFARVKRSDNLYNFINKDGKIISEKWFDFISSFYDGFAVVRKEKFSLMNGLNGQMISIRELCKIDKTGKLYKD